MFMPVPVIHPGYSAGKNYTTYCGTVVNGSAVGCCPNSDTR